MSLGISLLGKLPLGFPGGVTVEPHPDRIYHVQHQARAVAVPDDARVHTIQQENRVTNITYDPEDES